MIHRDTKPVPETRRFVELGLGVLFFHVLNSVLQEKVFHLPGFNHTVVLTFLQTLGIAVFAYIELQQRLRKEKVVRPSTSLSQREDSDEANIMSVTSPMVADRISMQVSEGGCLRRIERKVPLKVYFFLSVFSTVSALLTNEASHLLNYPTQVVFKSSKLFFVMSIRLLFGMANKKTGAQIRQEFASCLMIVVGLVAFTYATSAVKVHSKAETADASGDVLLGVGAIIIALCCDALLYVGEEKYCFEIYKAPSGEVILFTYGFAALNSLVTLITSGGVISALAFIEAQPIFPLLVIAFSLCNFFGTHYLLGIVSEFDSNAAVIVTSTRKMCTVLLSFLVYPKPFTLFHFMGLLCVSGGIFIYEYSRILHKRLIKLAESNV